jgi:hypothetical protein
VNRIFPIPFFFFFFIIQPFINILEYDNIMEFILFVIAFIISIVFLVLGITSGKRMYYAISFIFLLSIGMLILGTGLDLPSGWLIA